MLTFIGCGNWTRRDDGVGVVVAQRLAERLRAHPVSHVRAFDCGTAGFEIMYHARGSDALCVIDASKSGAEPGAIHELPGDAIETPPLPTINLHEFRWDHALAIGRQLYKDSFPRDVHVILIEAEDLGYGEGLSPRVAAAADKVYGRVLERCARYATAYAQQASQEPFTLLAARGSLQLPLALFERVFGERDAAAVVPRDGQLLVLPVFSQDGGVLVKQRNARGDRALDLAEALRQQGWDDAGTLTLRAAVDSTLGGLVLAPVPS